MRVKFLPWLVKKRASAYLHHKHDIHQSEVLDITVTCDGTWSKRGFTALYGVVVVASWDSGQVLDCEILTKYCSECGARDKMDKVQVMVGGSQICLLHQLHRLFSSNGGNGSTSDTFD